MKQKQIARIMILALIGTLMNPAVDISMAAKPKLSKTKLSLTVGKTAKLKVKNYKKSDLIFQ